MDKRARKAYDKAMNYYENGKIDKALELCEEVLSEGLDNALVLNFKGLLLYQKGSLNEAVAVWGINKDINNDNIAKKYIRDAVDDENRLELYKQGEQALKEFKVDKALGLFKSCAESDFNLIKVNTGIAMCYQRKGEFDKAKYYLGKVLSIDKDAIIAGIIEKELKENNINSGLGNFIKKFITGLMILFLFLLIGVGGYSLMLKFKNSNVFKNTQEDNNNIESKESNDKNEDEETKVKEDNKEATNTVSVEANKGEVAVTKFDKEKVKMLVANNDLDGVYEQLKNIKRETITAEETEIYNKAIDLMKDQGVSKFYEYGLWYFNQGNYPAAKSFLDKAYTYCEGNSLKEHILFYRASNSSKQSDNKNALAQFEEYYKQYPKGVYAQEALYELSLLSDSIDKEKSKSYANALMRDFPNSIYVNDNILSILKS